MENTLKTSANIFGRAKELLAQHREDMDISDFITESDADFRSSLDRAALAVIAARLCMGEGHESIHHEDSALSSYISTYGFCEALAVQSISRKWVADKFGEDAANEYVENMERMIDI